MKYLTIIFLSLALSFSLVAQIPRTLSYQGVLTDSSGTPYADGTHVFTFFLFKDSTGGNPLWTESKTIQIKRGLISTVLGDKNPFPDSMKFDRQYWLAISCDRCGEMLPRIPLTSVGYSLNALRADTAKVSITGGSWTKAGSDIYFLNGNVGIGITNPTTNLHIKAASCAGLALEGGSRKYELYSATSDCNGFNGFGILDRTAVSYPFVINAAGNVGIGTTSPNAKLHVEGTTRLSGGGALWDLTPVPTTNNPLEIIDRVRDMRRALFLTDGTVALGGAIANDAGAAASMFIQSGGNVGIGTTNPTARLEVAGRTKTQVLEITGGSDLAEPFPISSENQLEEGSVVVIDEANPGHVTLSTEPYDKKVAGVVSGAGGIKPGLTLKQEGLMPARLEGTDQAGGEGNQNIALSGRVYVKATSSNGSIKPGDRLVTSSMPGFCMKATDPSRCDGAVIGKAMSSLEDGEGLVLVLINLQ